MKRLMFFVFVVLCSWDTTATADEYLLRVDAIGYLDKSVTEVAPKETVLRSIEVVVRPDTAFHSKVITGKQTLAVSGKLRSTDDGRFDVQIRHVYAVDTGITVATKDLGRESVVDGTTMQTGIKITVGDPLTLGCVGSTTREADKPARRSETRYVLSLTKHTPDTD